MAWHLVMVFRTLGDIRVRIGSVTSGLGVVDRKISYGDLCVFQVTCPYCLKFDVERELKLYLFYFT